MSGVHDVRRASPATAAVRAGIDRDTAFGAVTPPLVLSSNFSFAGFGRKRAYDYTRDSVAGTIKDDLGYCNKERTAAIRRDLNRYLSGDYSPSARMAQ